MFWVIFTLEFTFTGTSEFTIKTANKAWTHTISVPSSSSIIFIYMSFGNINPTINKSVPSVPLVYSCIRYRILAPIVLPR